MQPKPTETSPSLFSTDNAPTSSSGGPHGARQELVCYSGRRLPRTPLQAEGTSTMVTEQRKRKTWTMGASREGEAGEPGDQQRQPQLQQPTTVPDTVSVAGEPITPQKTQGSFGRNPRNEKGQKTRTVFSKAAALGISDDEDAQTW